MAWEKMPANGRGTAIVTIRNTSIAFSAYFIKNEQLESIKYVEVFEDTELRRIGFNFTDNPNSYNALSLKQDGGKRGERSNYSRVVFTTLRKREWIQTDIAKNRTKYPIIKDAKFGNNCLFYIELGHSFSDKIDFYDFNLFPQISGVYRLFSQKNELLRIGEGKNIKLRLMAHKKNDVNNDVKSFDFCEIQNKILRKEEERRLLIQFKVKHNGFLPQLNSITA